jgi:protein-disulfide isomerase
MTPMSRLITAFRSRPALAVSLPAVALALAAFTVVGQPDRSAQASTPLATGTVGSQDAQRPIVLAQAATAPVPAPIAPSKSTLSADQRREIETVIKEYLLNNPEVIVEVQQALEAKQEKLQAERLKVAMKENAAEIFRSPTAPIVGNPKGDVTVVEFFDYNCGYCKKALPDLAKLVERDKNVKVVLKEFPILSKGSEETAKVALAAKLQGKYWEFHRAMLTTPGTATEASSLRVAEKAGLDMARLKRDIDAPEVKKELEDTRALAQRMGIQGTPYFLVGDQVIPGAPDGLADVLLQKVAEIRKAGGCKVC